LDSAVSTPVPSFLELLSFLLEVSDSIKEKRLELAESLIMKVSLIFPLFPHEQILRGKRKSKDTTTRISTFLHSTASKFPALYMRLLKRKKEVNEILSAYELRPLE